MRRHGGARGGGGANPSLRVGPPPSPPPVPLPRRGARARGPPADDAIDRRNALGPLLRGGHHHNAPGPLLHGRHHHRGGPRAALLLDAPRGLPPSHRGRGRHTSGAGHAPPPPPPHRGRADHAPPPPPPHRGRADHAPPPPPPHRGRADHAPPPPPPHRGRAGLAPPAADIGHARRRPGPTPPPPPPHLQALHHRGGARGRAPAHRRGGARRSRPRRVRRDRRRVWAPRVREGSRITPFAPVLDRRTGVLVLHVDPRRLRGELLPGATVEVFASDLVGDWRIRQGEETRLVALVFVGFQITRVELRVLPSPAEKPAGAVADPLAEAPSPVAGAEDAPPASLRGGAAPPAPGHGGAAAHGPVVPPAPLRGGAAPPAPGHGGAAAHGPVAPPAPLRRGAEAAAPPAPLQRGAAPPAPAVRPVDAEVDVASLQAHLDELYEKMVTKCREVEGCSENVRLAEAEANELRNWKEAMTKRASQMLESFDALAKMAEEVRLDLVKAGVAQPRGPPYPASSHPRYLMTW